MGNEIVIRLSLKMPLEFSGRKKRRIFGLNNKRLGFFVQPFSRFNARLSSC